jgi:hypothetical protein
VRVGFRDLVGNPLAIFTLNDLNEKLCELSAAVRSLNALTRRNRHFHILSYLSLSQTKLSAASVLPVPL